MTVNWEDPPRYVTEQERGFIGGYIAQGVWNLTESEWIWDVTSAFDLKRYELRVASFEYEGGVATFEELRQRAASFASVVDATLRTTSDAPPGVLADVLDQQPLPVRSVSDYELE